MWSLLRLVGRRPSWVVYAFLALAVLRLLFGSGWFR